MGKVTGTIVGCAHGITVTMLSQPAKTKNGKDRLWLQVRQNSGKEWKVYESLAYARSVDIAFVKEPERPKT